MLPYLVGAHVGGTLRIVGPIARFHQRLFPWASKKADGEYGLLQ